MCRGQCERDEASQTKLPTIGIKTPKTLVGDDNDDQRQIIKAHTELQMEEPNQHITRNTITFHY